MPDERKLYHLRHALCVECQAVFEWSRGPSATESVCPFDPAHGRLQSLHSVMMRGQGGGLVQFMAKNPDYTLVVGQVPFADDVECELPF